MNDVRICHSCGHVGLDVQTRVVEAPEGATEVLAGVEVPQRFRSEPRCVDRQACQDRVAAKEIR